MCGRITRTSPHPVLADEFGVAQFVNGQTHSDQKEANMRRLSSVVILGIGLLMCSGSPARAQLGDMGEAVKKGAADAAKQELMKQAGLPTAGAPAATPGAESGAANPPAGEPKVAPAAADTPAAAPGADTGAPNAPSGD